MLSNWTFIVAQHLIQYSEALLGNLTKNLEKLKKKKKQFEGPYYVLRLDISFEILFNVSY